MKIQLSDHFTLGKFIRFALPTIGMMLVMTTYGMVDGYFVSNYTGKINFASVNIAWPAMMAISALGMMIGTGGSAYIAKVRGEGDNQKACELFTMVTVILAATGIIFGGLYFVFAKQVSYLLGATDLLIGGAVHYGRILVLGMPLFIIQNAYQSLCVTAERPKMGLRVSIACGVTNIFGDWFLCAVLKWGLTGAAIATLASWIVGGMIFIVDFIIHKDGALHYTKFHFDAHAFGKICSNGIGEFLTSISGSIIAMIYNHQLISLVGENGIVSFGVIMYVCYIFQALFFGVAMAFSPIVGYNYGSNNHEELQNVCHKVLIILVSMSAVMTFLAEITARPFAMIYVGYDQEVLAMTTNAMQIYCLSFLISGFNVCGASLFTGLNNGKIAATISFTRTFIMQASYLLILPIFLGVTGVWLAITASEITTLCLTIFFIFRYKNTYHYLH